MNFIQLFIGSIFFMGIMIIGFWAMWYLLIPLIMVAGIVWIGWLLYVKWLLYKAEKQANGCHIRPIHSKTKTYSKTTVIDVDYTEVP